MKVRSRVSSASREGEFGPGSGGRETPFTLCQVTRRSSPRCLHAAVWSGTGRTSWAGRVLSPVLRRPGVLGGVHPVPPARIRWAVRKSTPVPLRGELARSPGRGLISVSKCSNCSSASAFQGPRGAGLPRADHLGFWVAQTQAPRGQGSGPDFWLYDSWG